MQFVYVSFFPVNMILILAGFYMRSKFSSKIFPQNNDSCIIMGYSSDIIWLLSEVRVK